MMRKFGPFFLVLAVLLSGCSNNESTDPLSNSQKKIIKVTPANADYILYMNVGSLRSTSLWDKYFKNKIYNLKFNGWIGDLEKSTGTWLNSGISELYISTKGDANIFEVFVLKDNLNRVKNYFNNAAKYHFQLIKNKRVYVSNRDSKLNFYFPDDSTLIFTDKIDQLKTIILGPYKSLADNRNLLSLINSIKKKNYYWIATNKKGYFSALSEKLTGSNTASFSRKLINSINNFTLSTSFTRGVKIESAIGCNKKKDAYLISTALKSALTMGLFSNYDYTLGEILKKTEITTDKNIIQLELLLNSKDINKLLSIEGKKNIGKNL